MIVEEYVYGSSKRLFVNTALGCNANCVYCYMPKLGYSQKAKMISGKEAAQLVKSAPCFIPGKDGTILSLGCYSECLDAENLRDTKTLLMELFPHYNHIQLATKQAVTREFCAFISEYRKYDDQMTICISMPTISAIAQLEPGTVSARQRILNIENCIKYHIPTVLYIKPFLENITERDLEDYIRIIEKYKIPVVVGEYLYTEKLEDLADVGNGRLYKRTDNGRRMEFIEELRKYAQVCEHSVEAMGL